MAKLPKPPKAPMGATKPPKISSGNVPPKEIQEDKQIMSNLDKVLSKDKDSKEETKIIKMENFFEKSYNNYVEFEKRAVKKGAGYKSPNYPMMERHLEGWDPGLYLFAGESNSGKSAKMMNVAKDLCSHEPNNLFLIYFALDDIKHEIIPRILAFEQDIPIGVASKPTRYQEMLNEAEHMDDNLGLYQQYLEKREKGLKKLREIDSKNLIIEDAETIKNSSDMVEYISLVKTFLKTHYMEEGNSEKAEKMNVIIAIDALNDINLDKKVYGRIAKDEKSEEIARFIKDLSVTFDCIVFASSHLRKLNGNRRPTLDDLREANTLVFEASVVFLVYNDVSKNKSGAKVYWNEKGELAPVLELDWAKNKKSSYKGRTFDLFRPNFSQLKECSKEDMARFEQIIQQE